MAARNEEGLTCNPFRIVGSEEYGNRGNIIGLADAAQRCLAGDFLMEIAFENSGGMETFGFDHAWIE